MENIKLKSINSIVRVELNDDGDYISLSADSATFFDNYVSFCQQIIELADASQKAITEIEARYTEESTLEERMALAKEIATTNIDFSDKATLLTDNLLGEGATYKYFKVLFEEVKDFKPDAECFIEFIEQISPVIEACYGKKIEIRQNISKDKVSKYKPQDFKKKATK